MISSSINPKPTEEENQPPGSNYGAIKYPFMDSRPLATLQFDDVARLIANGCFTFPDKEATDAFVYQYFARIHPGLPVFDEAECWKMHEDSVNLQCEKGRLPHNTTLSQLVRNIPSMLDAREVPRLLGGQQYCPQKLDPANSQRWPAGAVLGSHSDSSTAVSSDPNEPRQQKQRHIQLPIYGASTTTALELQDTRDKTGSLNANPTSLDFLDLEDVPGANRNLQPRDGQMELGEHSGHQRLADQGGDGEDSDIGDKSFVSPWFYAINSLREFTADIKP